MKVKLLEEEVKRLRMQLCGLANDGSEGGAAATVAPPGMMTDADCALRIQRFKEVFQRKVSRFKEAVYLLTGFKVRTQLVSSCHVQAAVSFTTASLCVVSTAGFTGGRSTWCGRNRGQVYVC